MAVPFNTVAKNIIIDAYSQYELMILRAFSEYGIDQDKQKLDKNLAIASQLLSGFARSFSERLSDAFEPGLCIEPYVYCDEDYKREVDDNVKKVVMMLMMIMKHIGDIASNGYNEVIVLEIIKALGEISLIIRYDIVSMPEDIIPEVANMGNVYAQMSKLSALNKDHFIIKNLWQNSARRVLPRFYGHEDTAIVIQGPVDYEQDFTLETLLRYKRLYPDAIIVLSTWKGDVKEEFRLVGEAAGITILENEKPDDGGPWNIKYQLKSSFEGIKKAQELGNIKYVLKTRTDQVFLLPEFILYFKNMLRSFPVNCQNMKERIIFLGAYASMCTYPFRITDFMSFGHIEDIKILYSPEENFDDLTYVKSNKEIEKSHYFGVIKKAFHDDFAQMCSMTKTDRMNVVKDIGIKRDPEVFLIQSFCESVVFNRRFTPDDDLLMLYWNFIKNCTIIIDINELLMFWDKYSYKYIDITSNVFEGGLTHATWLSVYYSDI